MGCTSSAGADAPTSMISKEIDKQIKEETKQLRNQELIKLLLLGPGEAGKSTILKQLIILYGKGFSEQEISRYGETIRSNLISCFIILIRAMDALKIPYTFDPKGPLAEFGREIVLQQEAILSSPNCANRLIAFWEDPGVQYCFSRAHEFQMLDCCSYLMQHISRICDDDYTPTEEDILRARTRTTVVSETKIKCQGYNLLIFDVGGQRSERKKWAQFFDDTQAIIFLVAMGSYDQMCEEDGNMNRLTEAMNLFSSICNNPLLKKIDMVLFLNKIDIFQDKLAIRPVSLYFPEYDGPNTFEESARFFRKEFQALNKYPKDKNIFVHYTHATDSTLTKKILGSVISSVTDSLLKNAGL
ncbi:G-protein alpha subunit [Obelidium mucronatum]|nr:G-protein alpha subunit [Obelidium mucronatum]